jgi:hypothetical protein
VASTTRPMSADAHFRPAQAGRMLDLLMNGVRQ